MNEQQKMYIWCRLAQALGLLAIVLGFLNVEECWVGIVIGPGTLAIAHFGLKFFGNK